MSDLKRLVESVSPKLDLHFGMPIHEPNPVSFWCPVIQKKSYRSDSSDLTMMVKIYATEIIFKSHKPSQIYQLNWISQFSWKGIPCTL